jgi:hypothetical protein
VDGNDRRDVVAMKYECWKCQVSHHVMTSWLSIPPTARENATRCAVCKMPFYYTSGRNRPGDRTAMFVLEREVLPWINVEPED